MQFLRRAVLAFLALRLLNTHLVLAQDPTGSPANPVDPPTGSDTTRTTSVSISQAPEGDKIGRAHV